MTDPTSPDLAGRSVAFDLGQCVVEPDGEHELIAGLLGVTPDDFEAAYWIHRPAYDRGLPDKEYWRRTARELGLDLNDQDLAGLLHDLVALDTAGWEAARPAALDILRDLDDRGVDVAVLSNAPTSYSLAVTGFTWYPLAAHWFMSSLIGCVKPDPAIYAHVERALGRAGGDLWFLDDRPENVDAASARGWHAHRWLSDADSRAWLVAEGFLDAHGD